MKLLLDTHIIIWLLAGDTKLKLTARQAIEQADSIAISEVSLWDISIKRSIGGLRQVPDLSEMLAMAGFERLHITDADLKTYESIESTHKDPFDLLLMSQAIAEQLILVTADRKILEQTVPGLQTLNASA